MSITSLCSRREVDYTRRYFCSGRCGTQCIPLVCFLLVPLWGQEQTPGQSPTGERDRAAVPASGSKPNGTNRGQQAKGTSNDWLFFLLPDFLTVENESNPPPLTAAEKFKVTAQNTFDPIAFGWYGAQAGISQAKNNEATFGQGAARYAKRYGVRFADGTIDNFFTRAIFPSVLHQDPRYYRLGKGGFWQRTGYALSRIFVTRSDSGSTQFNFSEVLGSATAAAISTATYHPDKSRNFTNGLDVWGTQVGYDALSYAIREFWPDIRPKLQRSKLSSTTTATGGLDKTITCHGDQLHDAKIWSVQ